MVPDLSVAEASVQLREKHSQWWLALSERKYLLACYLANDIRSLAGSLCKATYEETKNADPALKSN